jgi:hypothetical protein
MLKISKSTTLWYKSHMHIKNSKKILHSKVPHCRMYYICTLLQCSSPTVCVIYSYFVDIRCVHKMQDKREENLNYKWENDRRKW